MAITKTQKKLDTKPAATAAKKAETSKISFVQKVIKGDTYLVMSDPAFKVEDEFAGFYTNSVNGNQLIEPTFNPVVLQDLVQKNNVLLQCVEAMVVNIDGTDHDFVASETDGKIDETEKKLLTSFFKEPYPGTSFISMRKELRRDVESMGYGFLEVLRAADDSIAAVRNVVGHATRLVKLDNPVRVDKTVERNGKDVTFSVMVRERRFAQRKWGHDQKLYYYREFGATRHLHKETGEWETKEKPVPKEMRATELIMFGCIPEVSNPYFVPRWINQLPSVVGSRKAEESNLEYFDAGGLPPAIVFVQGGTLAGDVSEQLKLYLSGQTKNRNRAAVVEAQSSSGSLESAGQVKVTVERFGAEKANDAMFGNYDKAAERHVRMAFRFSELFLGDSGQANFATALTAYMVAEAQVFQPERTEFDETINATLVRGLGVKSCILKSHPITLKNVDVMLQAIGLIEKWVEPEDLVTQVNEIAGTTLKFSQEAADLAKQQQQLGLEGQQAALEAAKNPDAAPVKGTKPGLAPAKPKTAVTGTDPKAKQPAAKSDLGAMELFNLVQDYAGMHGMIKKAEIAPSRMQEVNQGVAALKGDDAEVFYQMLASLTLGSPNLGHLVAKTEGARNRLRDPAPVVDIEAITKPVLEAIEKREAEGNLAQKTMAAVVGVMQEGQKQTNDLLKVLASKEDRPITITAVLPARPATSKVVDFGDGRKATITSKD